MQKDRFQPRSRTALPLVIAGLFLAFGIRAEEVVIIPDIFTVINNGRDIPGSLDSAILSANGGANTDNIIEFIPDDLEFLTLTLGQDAPLPEIDLQLLDPGTERQVTLDATGTISFWITTAEDVGADFVLLHVESGQATLVDLDIFGSAQVDSEDVSSQFVVDADATLGFNYSFEYQIGDDINGEGSLVKEGDTLLDLLGVNTYTGGTQVLGGELRGHGEGIQGNISVAKDAALTWKDDAISQFSYIGEITGEGRFTKDGTRTLRFVDGQGSVAVDQGIEILAGILYGESTTITGDVAVAQDATLQLYGATADPDFSGNISGAGQVEKIGLNDLRLSGANTFTGGLLVTAGRILGDASSFPGNIELDGSTTEVLFEQAEDGVHSGAITGLGRLTKRGIDSTLTLTGTNSYQGGTSVQEGTLRLDTLSLPDHVEVSGGANVDFSLSDGQTYSHIVSGAGNFVKSGSGSLSLAAGQEYTGETQVSLGSLRLLGDLTSTSNIIVEAGGSLVNAAGALELGSELTNRGLLDLGGATDSVSLASEVIFEPAAELAVTVNDQAQASLLSAGNNRVLLDNIVVSITPSPGLYDSIETYEIIEAFEICTPDFCDFNGGTQGIGTTAPDFAFLEIGPLTVQPRDGGTQRLTFTLVQNANRLDDYAQTPNQRATAPAFDQLLNSGSPDALEIQESLNILTASQVPGVLNQVAGESLGAFTNPRLANATAFGQAISRRFTANDYRAGSLNRKQALRGAAGKPLAAAGAAGTEESSTRGAGGWLDAGGFFSRRAGEVNASTIKSDSGGIAVGFDSGLGESEEARLGVGFGYTRYSLTGNRGLSAEGNTYQAALYGSWEGDHYYAGFAGRYAYTDFETDRRIAFEDINRRAGARSSGQEAGFLAEAGVLLGDPTRLAYRPMVRLQYNRLTQDAFQENGAGDLSLAVRSESFDSWQTTLGARISTLFTLNGEFGIEPEFRAGWTHDFGNLARPVAASFYNVPGAAPFVTKGAPADDNQLFVGTGYLMSIAETPLVGLDYDYYTGSGYDLHVISAEFYLRW
ncbi:MAG: autotransporter domain-containing protein [Myxococcota bacterium]|jgi:fibronectin-binding autotransporter adhesin|nr:autotransporter domain-containing protein [Myxococcota bacterium]